MSITAQQALDCFASDDLIGIGLEADALRRTLHPENVVTYLLDEPTNPDTTTATLTLSTQSPTELLTALEAIRQQPSIIAFTLETTPEPTAVQYLKTLAIARLYLDTIPHIQTSLTLGAKVLQMALRFGANDIGLIPSAQKNASEEDLRRIIRDAGFQPVQRDATYRTLLLQ
jgi:2-iminoacetate synthase ThiH